MLIPLSWLQALLPALAGTPGREVADALVRAGLEVERVERLGVAHLVVGRVLAADPEPQKNGKTIRWCQVDTGDGGPRGIVCGAANFAAGDLVAVSLPGAVLPGGMEIAARSTYGHVSDGMICSARELALGEDHDGILVLDSGEPGQDASALLGLDDEVLDIAVTPDRGYQLSVRGVAREAASVLDLPFDDPGQADPPPLPAGHPVRIDDTDGCDRYVAVTVEGLQAATTPQLLARRLTRAGMRPISPAVDVTNYVMLELGQPLHAFDAEKITGPLVVRRAAPGEHLTTLDGVDRTLDPGDLVIADDSGPVALAGVMGGAATEITAATTRVLLEAAHFAPVSVARTARRHRLPSEAARRFERAVDPALPPVAARAAATLLAELTGARATGQTDVDHRPATAEITMPTDLPTRVGGRAVDGADVVRHLRAVGCAVEPGAGTLAVTPPPWRPDLLAPIDLVEEVLRLEGLDLLPSVLPLAPGGGGLTTGQRQRRAVSRALAAAGWVQVGTSPFTAPDAGRDGQPALAVRNPLSAEESVLRTSLLPGLAAAAARNVARGRADVALFETGAVFRDRRGAPLPPAPPARRPSIEVLAALDASLPEQPLHAGWLITGAAEPAGWWGAGRAADWTDAIAAAHAAARAVGLELLPASATATGATGASGASGAATPWHPGRCAALLLGGVVVGHAGELHPDTALAWGLPPGSCAGEIDLGPLLAAGGTVVAAPRPSTYPPSAVEVALVVGPAVGAAAVEAALRGGAGPLLESIGLLNVYTGPPIPAGDRSLAYRLRFRAEDRTLSGEEVNALRDDAVAAAAAATGASLRA